jgi:hypothetical protein
MSPTSVVALLLLGSLALVSCSIEIPQFTSGDAAVYEAGRPIHEWKLTADQVNHLNRRLAEHRAGWHPTLANLVPSFVLTLHGADNVLTVNIYPTVEVSVASRFGENG